ncbi:MAG TPA: hypothetical protein VFY90_13505 [Tepidiformaceae bacterium]|nr:hypothetical protein [Tepidiformaceae bacterium]
MELREPLDSGGEQEHRPRLLAEHRSGHVLLPGNQREREAQRVVHAVPNLPEEIHVLHLLRREVRQRVECIPMVDLEITGKRAHLRRDELFHVAKQVSVGSHLDVAELRLFLRTERCDGVGAGELRG